MQRYTALSLIALSLTSVGCSTVDDWGGVIPTAVGNAPFVYHPTLQQGNVITQEMVNQLRPGMDRSQVLYIMGSPTLIDTFHQDRWDYHYRLEEDGELKETYRLTLFFSEDKLSSMDGDFRPRVEPLQVEKEKVFVVPARN